MTTIPRQVLAALADPIYKRGKNDDLQSSLQRLPVTIGNGCFLDFYSQFEGPFSSDITSFTLLDLCNDSPTILSQTEECRTLFAFPSKFLVLSDMSAHSVLVWDSETDQVFNVDFEGGDTLLIGGQLEARWATFAIFLAEYFLRTDVA